MEYLGKLKIYYCIWVVNKKHKREKKIVKPTSFFSLQNNQPLEKIEMVLYETVMSIKLKLSQCQLSIFQKI